MSYYIIDELFEIAQLFADYMEADSHCADRRHIFQEGNKTAVIFSDITNFIKIYLKDDLSDVNFNERSSQLAYLLFGCLREFFISIFDVSYDVKNGDLHICLKNEPFLDELMATLFFKKYNYIIDNKLREEFDKLKKISPLTSTKENSKENKNKEEKIHENSTLSNKAKTDFIDIEKLYKHSVHFQ
ncbi:hypothetical protein Mgra_00001461 [Meloidogyne graminicola]|uniref:Uncharacterized protein n=1 Tax=Meloidogyne graminicola TaxID=189291 RepID=A0A8T0A0V5_9BILA|nr:hypothetical protein Mgra_00001461 [Meloidogyne graminicola]